MAQELGLPGIGYDCAISITNKQINRRHCSEINFPIPKSSPCKTYKDAKVAAAHITYPLIVKPSDNQGARGVAKVNNQSELFNKFQNALIHSANSVVQVEEFLSGRMLWLTGFISDYRYTNLLLGDTENFDIPDMFVHKISIHPALLSKGQKEKILSLDQWLFKSLGPRFGFTFTQYKINDDTGDIKLIETAIRSAAGFTSSRLIPLARGLDILPSFIEHTTGKRERVDFQKSYMQNRAVGNLYFALPPGVIHQVQGLNKLKSISGVDNVELDEIAVGNTIEAISNSTNTHGPITISGKDREECEGIINTIKETLFVKIENKGSIAGVQWD